MVDVAEWIFPKLGDPLYPEGCSTNDIENFKGTERIDNLVREICQNSLDAADKSNDSEPPEVIFEMRHLSTKLDAFQKYRKRLQDCRDFWGDKTDPKLESFLETEEAVLQQEEITVLVASDYNTVGLRGSHEEDPFTPWSALVGDGCSRKTDETSGGSFGIGKNAALACSALSMVFYNTFATDDEKAFIGVGKLATIKGDDGQATQRTGRYQYKSSDDERWRPIYEDDPDSLRDEFYRDKFGTDVIIAGFVQEDGWMDAVAQAVLKNFFVAISEKDLTVRLKDATGSRLFAADININGETISQLVNEYGKSEPAVAELYSAYSDCDAHFYLDILQDNNEKREAELFMKSESTYHTYVARFRENGMLIQLNRRPILKHFAAVLVVRGQELNALLRATENPQHKKWDYELIPDTPQAMNAKKKRAKTAVKKIEDEIKDLLKKQYESQSETELDATGISEYLPDDEEGEGSSPEGDDALRPKVKISVRPPRRNILRTETGPGRKGEGFIQPGEIHNSTQNPEVPHLDQKTKAVDPNGEGEKGEGVTEGEGSKDLTQPISFPMRAFPVSESDGLYRIIIVPGENYAGLYFSCSSCGENNRTEALDMENCTCNGRKVPVNGKTAGPLSVTANTPATLNVQFRRKERMVLSLHIREKDTA